MATLTLDQASRLIDAALAHAHEKKCRPMGVAVLDAAGQLKAFKLEDGTSGIQRANVAQGKANAAISAGAGTRALGAMAANVPQFVAAFIGMTGGRFVAVPGGVLIRDADGAVLGAMGVTGDTSDNDEACAVHAITSIGLKADPGAAPK